MTTSTVLKVQTTSKKLTTFFLLLTHLEATEDMYYKVINDESDVAHLSSVPTSVLAVK